VESLRGKGRNAAMWHFSRGNLAVGYGVMACGQEVMFALCLWFQKGSGRGEGTL
jgi:hypothetical protein